MGIFFTLMNSISDSWMSPSSMDIAMDLSLAFMCGTGLFFLLLPFLKKYPVSSPPESESDIPKVVKRKQINTRKKTATVKDCRDVGKNVEDTKTPSQLMKISTNQQLQDSTPQPLWNPLQKMNHLPLFQQLSYLKVLEHLIQKEFNQIFWGISSMFSESVVATTHVLRKPCLAEHKTVRFCDACGPAQDLSQAREPPHHSQEQPMPQPLMTPSLVAVTEAQRKEILPSSTPKHMPPCFKSRACGTSCPTTERGTQTCIPTENQPWQQGLHWKDTKVYDTPNHQAAISKPTGNFFRGSLDNKAIRPASILSEHKVHKNEEPQNEDNATTVGDQQGTPISFLPSQKLTQLQGNFPAKRDNCKSSTQLSQPTQPSILSSKSCKGRKMRGSVPLGLPLKKDIETCDIHNSIKKGLGLEGQDLPCNSSRSPQKELRPRNTALRTDKLFHRNPAEHHSFLDSETDRKLASDIMQLPVKQRRRPCVQILEARDLTPPGLPDSNLPQVVYPSSPICDSKAEYYSKAAMILENLHHQDPGGTLVESASAARLQSAVSRHSVTEIEKTQRAPPPAASHGPSKADPEPLQRDLSVPQNSLCFQENPPQSKTIQATETGSLQPNSTPNMVKHAPKKRFQDVDSGEPCCRVIVIDPEESEPPSTAKQSNRVEGKEEPPPAWRLSPGSSEDHSGQAFSISPRDSGSLEANRIPGHLQTPTPQHAKDSGLKEQAYSKTDLISKDQLVGLDPDGPNTIQPAKVSWPAQHSLPIFQNTCQNPKTSQALSDVCMRRHERVETENVSVPKDKIEVMELKEAHPGEERQSIIQSRGMNQGETLGRERPSIPSSTQLKDRTKTWVPEKGDATYKSSQNDLQYENFSTKYLGQGDSLQHERPPSAAEQMQEVITRNKVIYNMVAEIQFLVNILIQILENTEWNLSKIQGYKVESLTSQLGGSSHSSESLCATNHSRTTSRLSYGRITPEMQNYPFTYRGIGDELESGIENHRSYDQHLNQAKRAMCFEQIPMPMGYDLPCRYRGIEDKQAPVPADQRACDPGRTKIGMGHCPHRRPEAHKHSFRFRENEDKQPPGVDHTAFDSHQSTMKGMGCGHFLSPKENHKVKHRRSECSWPSVPAQPAFDPR
uniref:spermatogenesis-associated protein 31A6-like n=1 Tax=Arvicanthis niloticus TaxID=61156 RepID=UPI001485CD29|nr:spermatogenesis-associated protein 31A6-like [Arvicanthis niloticus]